VKHGFIAIDKPEGISSAKVVDRIKKKWNIKKIGHTGTLDPFATGLLLCGINKGTKISRFFLGGTKEYTAVIHLGIETDTLDLTGKIVKKSSKIQIKSVSQKKIVDTLNNFIGHQLQEPPIYSALKHNGQPLYRLARQGKAIKKPPRDIQIFSINLIKTNMPFIKIHVHCSSGTYIRSLAKDIGKKLGCGGHLSSLRRTNLNNFSVTNALTLNTLEKMNAKKAREHIISMTDILRFMPMVYANENLVEKIKFGRKIKLNNDIKIPKESEKSFIGIVNIKKELIAVLEFDKQHGRFNYCCVLLG